jgi:xanthine/CO dehydrogenase XdhC/CoxF family maturation factor
MHVEVDGCLKSAGREVGMTWVLAVEKVIGTLSDGCDLYPNFHHAHDTEKCTTSIRVFHTPKTRESDTGI